MIVDNTSKLKDILVFKPNTYYKFVVLLREKDGKQLLQSYNRKELIVKQWLVDSQEKLDEMLPDMLTYAKLFKGRLYVTTDRKSVHKTLFYMQDMINAYIRQMFNGNRTEISVKQLNKLLASASSSSECTDGDKYWLYDVDSKDNLWKEELEKHIKDKIVSTFETKNGYHIIAKRIYDARKQLEDMKWFYDEHNIDFPIEVKDNGLALVYYDDESAKNNVINSMKKDMQKVLGGIDFRDPVLDSAFNKATGEILNEIMGR